MQHLTDASLLTEMGRARKLAHRAPWDSHSSAWARHSREYSQLLAEALRRGLMPSALARAQIAA
jgi:hypothetical protein